MYVQVERSHDEVESVVGQLFVALRVCGNMRSEGLTAFDRDDVIQVDGNGVRSASTDSALPQTMLRQY